jgi:hypothetical protein
MAEVNSLGAAKGGGNDAARSLWLAEAPPIGQSYGSGRRPKKGDNVDIFKQFIIDCYERKMFHGDNGNRRRSGSGGDPQRKSKIMSRTLTPKPQEISFENTSSDLDLLNFGSEENSFSSFGNQSFNAFESTNPLGIAAPKQNPNEFQSFQNFDSPAKQKNNVFDCGAFDNSLASTTTTASNSATASSQQSTSFDAFTDDFNSGTNVSSGGVSDLFGTSSTTASSNSFGDNLLDVFSSPNTTSNSSNSASNDIFGGGDQVLFSSTPSNIMSAQKTGLEGGSTMMQMQQQQQQQRSFGGGAAAISNLGGLIGGGPMGGQRLQQQRQIQQSNHFDFVGTSMKSQLGVSSQNQPVQNTMLMQSPPSTTTGHVNSNTGLQSGSGMGMGMGMGGMGGGMGMGMGMGRSMAMGGGSGAISNMNTMVQHQQPTRQGSKGKSSNFPSAW